MNLEIGKYLMFWLGDIELSVQATHQYRDTEFFLVNLLRILNTIL